MRQPVWLLHEEAEQLRFKCLALAEECQELEYQLNGHNGHRSAKFIVQIFDVKPTRRGEERRIEGFSAQVRKFESFKSGLLQSLVGRASTQTPNEIRLSQGLPNVEAPDVHINISADIADFTDAIDAATVRIDEFVDGPAERLGTVLQDASEQLNGILAEERDLWKGRSLRQKDTIAELQRKLTEHCGVDRTNARTIAQLRIDAESQAERISELHRQLSYAQRGLDAWKRRALLWESGL
jgi:hypothetical protein